MLLLLLRSTFLADRSEIGSLACSFSSSVVLTVSCDELAWAVMDTAAWLIGQQECLRTGGSFAWEGQGLEQHVLEGAEQFPCAATRQCGRIGCHLAICYFC